jgi:hypothetical protein
MEVINEILNYEIFENAENCNCYRNTITDVPKTLTLHPQIRISVSKRNFKSFY